MPRVPSTGERRELKSIIALCGCMLGDVISALVCLDQGPHTAAEQPERPQSPVTPVALVPRLHTERTPYTPEHVHTAKGPLAVLLSLDRCESHDARINTQAVWSVSALPSALLDGTCSTRDMQRDMQIGDRLSLFTFLFLCRLCRHECHVTCNGR
jgi:hypothetical protein